MRQTRKASSSEDSAFTIQQGVLMAVMFLAFAVTVQATQPAWWTSTGAVSGTANDERAASQGQLKQFTQKAVLYLDTNLTGGAGTTLNGLVAGWSNYYATNGYSSTNPAPADLKAVNEGQLKYIANLVYPVLATAGYMSTNYPPWTQTNASDYKAANLGELKQIFAFELAVPQVPSTISVVGSVNSATVSWTEPVLNVQSFTIQQSSNAGVTWTNAQTVAGNVTSTTITGLSTGVNYAFRVVATNSQGTSAPSLVAEEIPISASITSPSSGQAVYVGGNLQFNVSVYYTLGTISQVQFYLDSAYLGTSTTPTFTGGMSYLWQPSITTAGSHVLTAVVTNSVGTSVSVSNTITAQIVDTDGDGLPDSWELQYFNTLAYGPTNVDAAGRTYLYDYQNGINPTDYYNGHAATLSIVQGDNQQGWLGSYLQYPLQVKVMNGTTAMTNAPVQFTITAGGGLLATSLAQPQGTTQSVSTDTNGIATVYYYQAAALTATGTVEVTANSLTTPINFTIDLPTGSPPSTSTPPPGTAPPPPSGLPTDGSVVLYSEVVSKTHNKVGASTFTTTSPPQKYLVENEYDNLTGVGPFVPANATIVWDPETETSMTSYSPVMPDMLISNPVPGSPFLTTLTKYQLGEYGNQTDISSWKIANEYTTAMLQQRVTADMPAFTGTMTSSSESASYELASDETSFSLAKMQYQFESISNATTTLNWLILFQPDVSNPDQTIRSKAMAWTGAASSFPMMTIDPTTQTYDNGTPANKNGTITLLPIEFVYETQKGNGDYKVLDKLPIFQPDPGTGEVGAYTATYGVYEFKLTANITTSAVASMNVNFSNSTGSFSGTLTETAANSGVFHDAASTVTLNLPVGTTTSSTTADTLTATVTSSALGLSGVSMTFQETGANTLVFDQPRMDMAVKFPSGGLSTTAVDTITLEYTWNEASTDVTLTETGANTDVFQSSDGTISLSIVGTPSFNPSAVDTMQVQLAASGLFSGTIACQLNETGANTCIFSNFSITYGDNPPIDPGVSSDGVFYARLKGMTLPAGQTMNMSVCAGADPDITGSTPTGANYVQSSPILLVPPGSGSPSYSGITTVSMDAISSLVKFGFYGQVAQFTKKAGPTAFLATGALGGGTEAALPSGVTTKNHLETLDHIIGLKNSTGWFSSTPPVLGYANSVKQTDLTIAKLRTEVGNNHSIFYILTHSTGTHVAPGGPDNTQFAGFNVWQSGTIFYKPYVVTASDISSNIGTSSYDLVFINGCASANDNGFSMATAYHTAFGSHAYVGWDVPILLGDAVPAAVNFFNALQPGAVKVHDATTGITAAEAGFSPNPFQGSGTTTTLDPKFDDGVIINRNAPASSP